MADVKRIKKAINWLISQGVVSSQKEVGARLGINNRSYLSQLVNAETPNKDFINKFTELAPMISPNWLMTGEGEMLKPKEKETVDQVEMIGRPFRATTKDEGVVNVRYFYVSPSATFQEFCEGQSEDVETTPIVAPPGEIIDESSCVFEIHGDSMLPTIPNHAKVLCKELSASRWHTLSEGVIAIAYADKFVIKRIIKNQLSSDDYLIIGSDNPDYAEEVMVQRADIRCIFQARHVLSYPIH